MRMTQPRVWCLLLLLAALMIGLAISVMTGSFKKCL